MKSLVKNNWLRYPATLVFVMAACSVAFADNGDEDLQKQEDTTTFEERMQKEISVDFRDTPIEDVLRIMADQADVDIIKSPQVTGVVTATLTNVPLEEALNNILAAHGFGYILGQNMIRIAPISEISEGAEMLVNRIYRITYADVKEVEKALQKFLSKRGSLSASPGSSNIIVTDTETKISAIDTFIKEVDRITPQILVEVRIYDITTQDTLDLGIQWQAGQNTTYTGGVSSVGSGKTGETSPFTTGLFSNPTSETGSDVTAAFRFGWLNSNLDIDVLISAQKERVDAKLLANPRILVLDNETALFDIVREIPYTEISTSSAGTDTETVKFKNVGVKLQVKPHVTRDKMLRLHIVPEFGVVVSQDPDSGVPTVDTRKVNTIALVKDGQTVVLGGLRKKDVGKQVNKVPLLGDIPIVGELFKFRGEDTMITELVVFITPRIIEEPVLSQVEAEHFKETNFGIPKAFDTDAEKAIEEITD